MLCCSGIAYFRSEDCYTLRNTPSDIHLELLEGHSRAIDHTPHSRCCQVRSGQVRYLKVPYLIVR